MNIDLDDHVSVAIDFSEYDNLHQMKFHFADDHFGVKWYPTKSTINKLIKFLQDLEPQMTDDTNKEFYLDDDN
jgi:hypothetical protein